MFIRVGTEADWEQSNSEQWTASVWVTFRLLLTGTIAVVVCIYYNVVKQ